MIQFLLRKELNTTNKTEKHVVFAEQLGYDNHRQRKPTFENITAY